MATNINHNFTESHDGHNYSYHNHWSLRWPAAVAAAIAGVNTVVDHERGWSYRNSHNCAIIQQVLKTLLLRSRFSWPRGRACTYDHADRNRTINYRSHSETIQIRLGCSCYFLEKSVIFIDEVRVWGRIKDDAEGKVKCTDANTLSKFVARNTRQTSWGSARTGLARPEAGKACYWLCRGRIPIWILTVAISM